MPTAQPLKDSRREGAGAKPVSTPTVIAAEVDAPVALIVDGAGMWEWQVGADRVWWDAQMFRIYGIPPTRDGFVPCATWTAAISPDDWQESAGWLRDMVRRAGEGAREFRIRRESDGECRHIQGVETVRLDSRRQPVAVLGTQIDVTARKEAESQARRRGEERAQREQALAAQLGDANRELVVFSYSVSHDLRSPLRAVDGFSQALVEDFGSSLPAGARRYLETIRASTRQMSARLDALLTFSRLGRQPMEWQPVETGRVVRRALEELGEPWRDRKVQVRIGHLPSCHGDPGLLKQVWLHLLSNALKYTRGRAVAEIEISGSNADGPAVFSVRDNGVGFDQRYAEKLFGLFQRLHRAEDYEGTGIGLAIVQRIIHRHGGRVWAEAREGLGATFHFTLPETIQP